MRCLEDAPGDAPAALYLARCEEYLRNGHAEGVEENDLNQTWSEEYSSGVAEVDSQHRSLLSQINALAAAVREARTRDTEPILAIIERDARQLFAAEAILMQESRYPFLSEHLRQHQRFQENLSRLSGEIGSETENPIYMAFRIKLLLMDWIINHSTKTDRHLGHHLKSRSGG